jgi:hypothetical protein
MNNDIRCRQVVSLLSDFIDGELPEKQKQAVETHIQSCRKCRAILDGMQNVTSLAGDSRLFQPPAGFADRLYTKVAPVVQQAAWTKEPLEDVPMGITADFVPVGSHLIYFWQTNAEFESGVRFLHPGLGKNEHCIIFGHDEALEHVKETLEASGYDPAQLIRDRKLTVLRRHASAQTTLAEIGGAIEAALADGARMVRFLGNLGLGSAPLPAGEDDVLELETKATALMGQLPCVVVCMYDVRTVPGRLVFKGGLETHKLSVSAGGVRENPFYVCEHDDGKKTHHLQ